MSNSDATQAPPKPRDEDVSSPAAIIKALYDTISGPAGKRNWYRLRSLYIDGARLIPIGKRVHKDDGFAIMTVDEFILDAQDYLAENDFYEKEVVCKTHRFGDMIHAFSTYECRTSPEAAPFARGINGIQLLFREGRWWIVTVMWDNESKENPVPEEFLPYLW
jgi:hypothetical protein